MSCFLWETSRLRIRMYRYGLHELQYRYHTNTDTDQRAVNQATAIQSADPVPVEELRFKQVFSQ
jgi:hypothetical protein